ncbi:hypothetical protein ACQCN2_13170 [Brevibacillus ginsengisoli]|uniref:hypothetical protein n=1 Tax=Brevibacillus ginsengisoli TaxID=363854 RepID=UPI003CF8A2C5
MKKHAKKIAVSVLLTASFLMISTIPIYSQPDISKIQIDTSSVSSAQELTHRSKLIVLAQSESADKQVPTTLKVDGRKVVKFTQKIHIKQFMKGNAPKQLTLVSEGVEPLPDASSPLNKLYPGPLVEGDYILFLRPIPGTEWYSLVGLWQGVYPLLDGKSIALKGIGFPVLNNLTPSDFKRKVDELKR